METDALYQHDYDRVIRYLTHIHKWAGVGTVATRLRMSREKAYLLLTRGVEEKALQQRRNVQWNLMWAVPGVAE